MLKKKDGERSEPLVKKVRGAACWVGFKSQDGEGPVGKSESTKAHVYVQ